MTTFIDAEADQCAGDEQQKEDNKQDDPPQTGQSKIYSIHNRYNLHNLLQ